MSRTEPESNRARAKYKVPPGRGANEKTSSGGLRRRLEALFAPAAALDNDAETSEAEAHHHPGRRLWGAGAQPPRRIDSRKERDRGKVFRVAVVAPGEEAKQVGGGVSRQIQRHKVPVDHAERRNIHQRRRGDRSVRIGAEITAIRATEVGRCRRVAL